MSLVTMREILPYAEEKKIAIPAFNIDTMEITQAILDEQSMREPKKNRSISICVHDRRFSSPGANQ